MAELFLFAGIVLIAVGVAIGIVCASMLWPEKFGGQERRRYEE